MLILLHAEGKEEQRAQTGNALHKIYALKRWRQKWPSLYNNNSYGAAALQLLFYDCYITVRGI
jgi:hypothetical protein